MICFIITDKEGMIHPTGENNDGRRLYMRRGGDHNRLMLFILLLDNLFADLNLAETDNSRPLLAIARNKLGIYHESPPDQAGNQYEEENGEMSLRWNELEHRRSLYPSVEQTVAKQIVKRFEIRLFSLMQKKHHRPACSLSFNLIKSSGIKPPSPQGPCPGTKGTTPSSREVVFPYGCCQPSQTYPQNISKQQLTIAVTLC